ncbi:MAG TPA: rhodanese-like domain-containing protein [Gemmatimonadales bacterium]|nr:rhodanese-like domain-containing protein [Gemmatimonadales bacterium]
MLIRRFYNDKLAQASYLIGCSETHEGLIVDPNRDIEQYLRAASAEGLRISHVTETHIHADFLSGARELANRAGAELLLSGEGGPDWLYAFAESDGARLLRDGDSFMVGHVRIDVLHTPGHTPEHLTFIVTDTATADLPMGACTGDFIFVGDVGRPDLLERAAGVAGTMEAGARQLYRSLQRMKDFPDWLQLWPGHGAGSACGKALGAVPQTTLGYERLFNWGLASPDEESFVAAVLSGQPDPPTYFATMKRLNREGPEPRRSGPVPLLESTGAVGDAAKRGAMVIDVRPAKTFAAGHWPGTINIPLNRSFLTWAGWLVPYDRDIYLIGDNRQIAEAANDLALIGLDRVAGALPAAELDRYIAAGGKLVTTPQLEVAELAAQLNNGKPTIVDVRAVSEWRAGHLPGVINIPLGELTARLDELPRETPIVVQCQGGTRSAIGASILAANGFSNVVNLTGGFRAWTDAGNPVEKP